MLLLAAFVSARLGVEWLFSRRQPPTAAADASTCPVAQRAGDHICSGGLRLILCDSASLLAFAVGSVGAFLLSRLAALLLKVIVRPSCSRLPASSAWCSSSADVILRRRRAASASYRWRYGHRAVLVPLVRGAGRLVLLRARSTLERYLVSARHRAGRSGLHRLSFGSASSLLVLAPASRLAAMPAAATGCLDRRDAEHRLAGAAIALSRDCALAASVHGSATPVLARRHPAAAADRRSAASSSAVNHILRPAGGETSATTISRCRHGCGAASAACARALLIGAAFHDRLGSSLSTWRTLAAATRGYPAPSRRHQRRAHRSPRRLSPGTWPAPGSTSASPK